MDDLLELLGVSLAIFHFIVWTRLNLHLSKIESLQNGYAKTISKDKVEQSVSLIYKTIGARVNAIDSILRALRQENAELRRKVELLRDWQQREIGKDCVSRK